MRRPSGPRHGRFHPVDRTNVERVFVAGSGIPRYSGISGLVVPTAGSQRQRERWWWPREPLYSLLEQHLKEKRTPDDIRGFNRNRTGSKREGDDRSTNKNVTTTNRDFFAGGAHTRARCFQRRKQSPSSRWRKSRNFQLFLRQGGTQLQRDIFHHVSFLKMFRRSVRGTNEKKKSRSSDRPLTLSSMSSVASATKEGRPSA